MGLDIRLPIGLMFLIFGLLLTAFGLAGSKDIYQHSLGININLGWGMVLIIFGGIMLWLGRKGLSKPRGTAEAQGSAPVKRMH